MPKRTIAVEDSDDDEPVLASPSRPRRSTASSAPKYKIEDSDEDEKEEDDSEDGSDDGQENEEDEEGSGGDDDDSKNADSEQEKDSDDENLVVIARSKDKKEDHSDSDDEQRFLALMEKYSPAKPQAETKTKTPNKAVASKDSKSTPEKSKKRLELGVENAPAESAATEDAPEASTKSGTSKIKFSRSVPLMIPNPKRISRNTFLIQGDSGVIGTLKSSDSTLQLDVKGQLFQGHILPSSTLMVVDVGPSEVRVEAVMNDFVQLERMANPHDDDQDVEVEMGDSDLEEDFDDAPKSKKRKGGGGGSEGGGGKKAGGAGRSKSSSGGKAKKSGGGGKSKSKGGGGSKHKK